MATAKQLLQVVQDTRLSAEARILVLHVAGKGDGPHEISAAELSRALNQASEKVVRRAVNDAIEVGWVARTMGGRGHSPFYAFLSDSPANSAAPSAPDSTADSAGSSADNPADSTESNAPSPSRAAADKVPTAGSVTVTPAKMGTLNGAHTCEQAEPLVGRKDARKEPPVVPLSIQAEDAFAAHADRLTGLRGSLRDYLVARLSGNPTSQAAYVHRVVTMLDDPGAYFRGPDGELVPEPDRPKVIAQALNELLQHGEQRTILPGMERMRWPDGDSRNLRTKIRILIQQRYDDEHRGNGVRHARAAAAATPGTSGASSLSGERRNGFGDPD